MPLRWWESCILSKFYIKPQRYSRKVQSILVVSYRNSTSNHNRAASSPCATFVVSYRNSTSNHNTNPLGQQGGAVVSYRNSTSNHNTELEDAKRPGLYLIEILHQTTTASAPSPWPLRCILSKFYIKPQPSARVRESLKGCILSKFYIKPQRNR